MNLTIWILMAGMLGLIIANYYNAKSIRLLLEMAKDLHERIDLLEKGNNLTVGPGETIHGSGVSLRLPLKRERV